MKVLLIPCLVLVGFAIGKFYDYPRKRYKNKLLNWLRQLG